MDDYDYFIYMYMHILRCCPIFVKKKTCGSVQKTDLQVFDQLAINE